MGKSVGKKAVRNGIPLVYPIAPSDCKNVLLIDSAVKDAQIFASSVNASTFPIIYSRSSTKAELFALLKTTFPSNSIERIGLVFTDSNKTFLDKKPFFSITEPLNSPYSENVEFILSLLKEFSVKNIDYLACDTLNSPSWVNYYALLTKETSVVVGASNDKTGNIKYGGDWLMESTGQDIELIYFTKSIEYYTYLLDNPPNFQALKLVWNDDPNVYGILSLDISNAISNADDTIFPSYVYSFKLSVNDVLYSYNIFFNDTIGIVYDFAGSLNYTTDNMISQFTNINFLADNNGPYPSNPFTFQINETGPAYELTSVSLFDNPSEIQIFRIDYSAGVYVLLMIDINNYYDFVVEPPSIQPFPPWLVDFQLYYSGRLQYTSTDLIAFSLVSNTNYPFNDPNILNCLPGFAFITSDENVVPDNALNKIRIDSLGISVSLTNITLLPMSGTFVSVGYNSNDASNITYSRDGGQTWTVATNNGGLFAGDDGKAIAYGSGKYVAVGDSNIGFSNDGGQSWQVANGTNELSYNGVAYGYNRDGSGIFVTVSLNDYNSNINENIAYSLDGGQNWLIADNPDGVCNTGCYGVAYGYAIDGSGVFVAVGGSLNDASSIGYSLNGGQNWQVASATDGLFASGYGYAVAYGLNQDGSGVFVAVGDSTDNSKKIGFSPDGGQTWQVATETNGLFSGGYGFAVAYGLSQDGSGVFVTVGKSLNDASNIGYSPDGGQTWLVASEANGLFIEGYGQSISYGYNSDGSGVFVAAGDSTDNSKKIGYSFDGNIWTVVSEANGLSGKGIAFAPFIFPAPPVGTLAAVGSGADEIGFSTNGGQNWQIASETSGLFSGGYGKAIASDGSGVFVTVGNNYSDSSNIGYSNNMSRNIWQVTTETNGLFGGGGYGNGVAYGLNQDGSGIFVAVGYSLNDASNIGYSPDGGQTWQIATATNGLFQGNEGGYGVAYGLNQDGSGVFVAVGSSLNDASNIGYSPDGGQTWQIATETNGLFSDGKGYGIAYGHTLDGSGVFVAVGDSDDNSKKIGYSLDGGKNWLVSTNSFSVFSGAGGYGIASDGNSLFVAVGYGNVNKRIGYSSDGGHNWLVAAHPNGLFDGGGYGNGITYAKDAAGNGRFVAVGFDSNEEYWHIGYSTDGNTWTLATDTDGVFSGGGCGVAFISQVSTPTPMILTFDITADNTEIQLPLIGTDISVEVNWGDGTIDNLLTHTYLTASTPTVTITLLAGTITRFGTDGWLGSEQITGITQWGEWPALTRLNYLGGSKLTQVPSTVPSTVTDMSSMFREATAFNQDIGQWTVGNVENMSSMFYGATAFNQDIGQWTVGSVENMSTMFRDATAFNQDIGQWTVGSVTDMSFMFRGATAFNQDIGQWTVGSVTDMSFMFRDADAFNQDIGQWPVGSVTNMSSMFRSATAFNQDIGQWPVGSVTNMSSMFLDANAFNQDIGQWPVGSVTNMSSMFSSTNVFNQDLGQWNVSQVTDMEDMFLDASLDVLNYSNTLIGWASLASLQQYVPLGAPAGGYINANAVAAVAILTVDNYWIITPPPTIYTIQTTITFTDLSFNEWTPTLQTEVINTVATTAGVPESRVNFISATAGSVIVILYINGFTSWNEVYQAWLALNGITFTNPDLNPFTILNIISPPPPMSNICFPSGTPIKTDQGIIPIDQLNPARHTIKKQAIQHITKTITQDKYLICFEKNVLGPNMPSARTLMSKDHKILFAGTYIPASQFLKLSDKIKKVPYTGENLYNVLLENYSNMQVNNLVCETLHPDNVIAKLYNNYKEAERPNLVYQLNASLLERNALKYKDIVRKISRE